MRRVVISGGVSSVGELGRVAVSEGCLLALRILGRAGFVSRRVALRVLELMGMGGAVSTGTLAAVLRDGGRSGRAWRRAV